MNAHTCCTTLILAIMTPGCAASTEEEQTQLDELAAVAPPGKVAFEAIAQPPNGGTATVSVQTLGSTVCNDRVCIADPLSTPTFAATPNSGWTFTGWTGCTFPSTNAVHVFPPTLTSETCVANFTAPAEPPAPTEPPGPVEPPSPPPPSGITVSVSVDGDGVASVKDHVLSSGCDGTGPCQTSPGSSLFIDVAAPGLYAIVSGVDGCPISKIEHVRNEVVSSSPYATVQHYRVRLENVQQSMQCVARVQTGHTIIFHHRRPNHRILTSRQKSTCWYGYDNVYETCTLLPGDYVTMEAVDPDFKHWSCRGGRDYREWNQKFYTPTVTLQMGTQAIGCDAFYHNQ